MKLVIISGMAATGKTTIGQQLSQRLGWAFCSKDLIKEAMFDERPRSTWHVSWYEKQAKRLLFEKVSDYASNNKPLIIETNFVPADGGWLRKGLASKNVKIIEIYCRTHGFTHFKRFVRRNAHGDRHKGHHDRLLAYIPVFLQACLNCIGIQWPNVPLHLSHRLKELDTTDMARVDYESLEKFIRQV